MRKPGLSELKINPAWHGVSLDLDQSILITTELKLDLAHELFPSQVT